MNNMRGARVLVINSIANQPLGVVVRQSHSLCLLKNNNLTRKYIDPISLTVKMPSGDTPNEQIEPVITNFVFESETFLIMQKKNEMVITAKRRKAERPAM
jgi:hypothetical protein